jgi:opine dehydrogenase
MRVCILGAGSIAFGMAAALAEGGHRPVLWSPSGRSTAELAKGEPLVATGAVEASAPLHVASICADAVGGADAVVVALPGYGHKAVMEDAAPHLASGQPVIVSSHASFGALYLSRLLAARGVSLPIVVWGTTVVTGRKQSGTHVHVATVRQKVDLATVPQGRVEAGHALCTALFGDRFVQRDGLLAIALSNLNPQNHLGIALCNVTRMERGEDWGQGENVTPSVGRLIEALDAERLAIAEALGLPVRTVREHFSLSFHVPMGTVSEMNQAMHAAGRGGKGPTTLETRYVLEDVPFGLVPTQALGRLVDRPALLHEAGTRIFSALYGRDLSLDNDLLPEIGLGDLSIGQLRNLARDGFWRPPSA